MIQQTDLKNLIPYGFGKIIATKAGVSTQSVSNFLNGKTKSHKIEKAVLEVAAEIQAERTASIKQLKKAL